MSRKEKQNMAHSVFQRLLNRAKDDKVDFNLLLSRYGMERFIYRLAVSPYSGRFILKGASLFLVWKGQNYRVTRDADFLGFGDPSPEKLKILFQAICLQECSQDDGMVYPPDSIKAEAIREDQEYDGVRVTLIGKLGTARIPLQIDIGFGDAVTPEPEEIDYPVLLDAPAPRLQAYPRYTLISEKLEAMVRHGMANSRMKDFFDIWLIAQLFEFEGGILETAISNTFDRRGTPLPQNIPVAFTSDFHEDEQKQQQWNAFVRKSRPDVEVRGLSSVVSEISTFIMPVLEALHMGGGFDKKWSPSEGWAP